ncbi:MAG: glycoside hydrolase family 88 protein [Chitinispirillaceae bacterium]|nr:glycoside hydrolase family 88 protein [Chitinispirillaceae bacterium]
MRCFLRKPGYLSVLGALVALASFTHAATPTNNEVAASSRKTGKATADYWIKKDPVSTNHYADICAFYACLLYGEAAGDSTYLKSLATRYKRTAAIPTGDVDKNSVGILPLYLFTQTRDSALLKLGKSAADASLKAGGYKRDAIDDTYMTGSLMIQAYRATGDTKYLDFCADYIVYYMDKLLQSNGLYWHRIGSKHFWSRGNGWGAASTTELLLELPENHSKYADVLAGFKKHMNGLLEVRRDDGMWMQLLDSKDSRNWVETSGSAMFLFAMFTGMKKGWLDSATFLEPAKKGWMALAGYVGSDGKLKNICTGFWGDGTASSYLNAAHNEAGNSHGTAGLLWAASAAVDFFNPPVSVESPDRIAVTQPVLHSSTVTGAVFDLLGRITPVAARPEALQYPSSIVIMKRNADFCGAYLNIRQYPSAAIAPFSRTGARSHVN